MRRASHSRRAAFTLIELLMVIAIIGILVGLIVPAVMYARRTIMQRAIAIEVRTLAGAVDQYKNKFGDYPPDGTDSAIFARHCRKLFPHLAAMELTAVTGGSNCSTRPTSGVMDPPEALVFFLGGFSTDPVHPFTGTGGPLSATSNTTLPYQYNVDRNEPLYEFKQAQLTLDTFDLNGTLFTVSNDESQFGLPTPGSPSGVQGDLIPVYHPAGKTAPFVYFDSRTYSLGGTFFNYYNPAAGAYGIARPYKSSKGMGYDLNTKVTPTFPPTNPAQLAVDDLYYRYANERSYQIISAGLDDLYGGVISASNPPTFYCFPSGSSLNIAVAPGAQTPVSRYNDTATGEGSAQLDNATNFADGILGDQLP